MATSPPAAATRPGAEAIPDMPAEPSARPTAAEWKTATKLGTARECDLVSLRDWVKLQCPSGFWSRTSDWGRPGKDHFETLEGRGMEARLRRGTLLRALHYSTGVRFLMAWPSTDAKPWALSLEASRPAGTPEPLPAPQPIPEVPVADADRPIEADWVAAVPVDTSRGQPPVVGCSIGVRGQWARLTCRRPGLLHSLDTWGPFEGFGSKGVDHVMFVVGSGEATQFDFRLRRGGRARGILAMGLGTAGQVALTFEWPKDEARPTVLSLAEVRPTPP